MEYSTELWDQVETAINTRYKVRKQHLKSYYFSVCSRIECGAVEFNAVDLSGPVVVS